MSFEFLVVTGDGLGNAIQSTPLIRLMRDQGHIVDLWMPGVPPGTQALFDRWARHIYSSKPNIDKYFGVLPNWLMRGHYSGRKVKPGLNPIVAKCSESYAHVAALYPAWDKPVPAAFCNHKHVDLPEGRHLALHMGSKTNGFWLNKRYKNYGFVVSSLLKDMLNLHVHVLIGPRDDVPHVDGAFGDRVHVYRNKPLMEVAGVIKECDVFLGNDAGLAHVAAALETPTYIIYGPTEVRKNLPPHNAFPLTCGYLDCRPCQLRKYGVRMDGSECEIECMQKVSPGYVARVIWDHFERMA